MSDFNVQVKIRSGRIVRAMRAKGFTTVAELCRAMGGANQVVVGKLVNLKASPVHSVTGWRQIALDIAAALGVPEEELWPNHMQEVRLRQNAADFDMDHEQLATLLAAPAAVDRDALAKMFSMCTSREMKVLEMRFGMDGGGETTLAEIGEELGITGAAVRQIEQKAFRKARHRAHNLGLNKADDLYLEG